MYFFFPLTDRGVTLFVLTNKPLLFLHHDLSSILCYFLLFESQAHDKSGGFDAEDKSSK